MKMYNNKREVPQRVLDSLSGTDSYLFEKNGQCFAVTDIMLKAFVLQFLYLLSHGMFFRALFNLAWLSAGVYFICINTSLVSVSVLWYLALGIWCCLRTPNLIREHYTFNKDCNIIG